MSATLDYRLRPAKHVVRKLLAEAFLRLDRLVPTESYHYVGFGGLFFADFWLFHRMLGFEHMISIEENMDEQGRFRNNRPFRTVDLHFGSSSDVLPTLEWSKPTVVWLDGTRPLNTSMLEDVAFLGSVLAPYSVVAVTVNVEGMRYLRTHPQEDPELELSGDGDETGAEDGEVEFEQEVALIPPITPLDLLARDVGAHRIPHGLADSSLRGWGYADISFKIADAEIADALARRCSGDSDPLRSTPIANLHYQDEARMLVAAWLVFHESARPLVEACRFDSLSLGANGSREIRVPLLTFKELKALDALLPDGARRLGAIAQKVGVSRQQVDDYSAVYRHYPTLSIIDAL